MVHGGYPPGYPPWGIIVRYSAGAGAMQRIKLLRCKGLGKTNSLH